MSMDAVLLMYQSRLHELQAGLAQVRLNQTAMMFASVIAIALFLMLGFLALQRRIPLWSSPLSLPVAVISARKYRRYRSSLFQLFRLQRFYRRGVARLEGNWVGNGISGEEFSNSSHPYERDLGLFGEGSLFELLCTTRTEIGRRRLASYLLEAPSREEALARQEAVRELQSRTELREQIALLGEFDFQESKWETFVNWLESPARRWPAFLRPLLLMTSSLLAGLVLAGWDHAFSWGPLLFGIAPLLVFIWLCWFCSESAFRFRWNRCVRLVWRLEYLELGLESFSNNNSSLFS